VGSIGRWKPRFGSTGGDRSGELTDGYRGVCP
jgi:hypothetical protein